MPDCPTAAQLITAVKSLTSTNGDFQTAWFDSFPDGYHCCEQGGFIYVDLPVPARITRVFVVRAPKGDTMNQRTKGPNAAISLDKPGIKTNNVILVANFHTHPLSDEINVDPEPSFTDIQNSYKRQIPGIVVSRPGLWSYGPKKRTDLNNPKGYPSLGKVPAFPPDPVLEKRNPPPTTVRKQWPEGTGKVSLDEEDGDEDVAAVEEDDDDGVKAILAEWSDEGIVYWEPVEDSEE